MNISVPWKAGDLLTSWATVSFLKTLLHGVCYTERHGVVFNTDFNIREVSASNVLQINSRRFPQENFDTVHWNTIHVFLPYYYQFAIHNHTFISHYTCSIYAVLHTIIKWTTRPGLRQIFSSLLWLWQIFKLISAADVHTHRYTKHPRYLWFRWVLAGIPPPILRTLSCIGFLNFY
jgi:hypothetical protein